MTKILVIEDNARIRREIVTILHFEGFEVTVAENGRTGLEHARESLPDLILCDLMMPEMDGYTTLEAVRSLPSAATIPFIFLTARVERADIRRGMELGADDYVTKPFTAGELVAAVKAGLAKKARAETHTEERIADLSQRISATLPHELRTPLAAILGYGELLSVECHQREPEEIARMADQIVASALRLNRLTTNLLLLTQLELFRRDASGPLVRADTPIRVDVVVRTAVNRKAREAARECQLCLEAEDLPVAVGEQHLQKLVEELLDNAFKFSPPETPVRVRVGKMEEHVTLQISDKGRGMTSAQVATVGPYVQFDRAAHEQQGMGLGLSIAIRLAEIYGGALEIDSEPASGTTITVSLPLSRGDEPGAPQPGN